MQKIKDLLKNKKIILIIVITLIIITMIVGLLGYFVVKEKNDEQVSKINKLYETLKDKTSYSFEAKIDDNNKIYYANSENKAYINTIYNEIGSKFIIKDGNTYLILDDMKTYYTYKNNETDLEKIEIELKNIKDLKPKNGKEKIHNKNYKYEEYKILTSLSMLDTSNIKEEQEVKTRFYFKGNDLVYIKTIIGEKEEILKVDISNKVDKKIFDIPTDYKEM